MLEAARDSREEPYILLVLWATVIMRTEDAKVLSEQWWRRHNKGGGKMHRVIGIWCPVAVMLSPLARSPRLAVKFKESSN